MFFSYYLPYANVLILCERAAVLGLFLFAVKNVHQTNLFSFWTRNYAYSLSIGLKNVYQTHLWQETISGQLAPSFITLKRKADVLEMQFGQRCLCMLWFNLHVMLLICSIVCHNVGRHYSKLWTWGDPFPCLMVSL